MFAHLIVIGCSGLGKEVASQAQVDLGFEKEWIILGFLDSRNKKKEIKLMQQIESILWILK